jgi:hypothetical protein
MELQNIYRNKNKKNTYRVFHTLGDEKKVNYELLNDSLTKIEYDVDIFAKFLSPRSRISRITKKPARQKTRRYSIINYRRIPRNNTSISSNLYYKSSSASFDKLYKNNYSTKFKEVKKESPKLRRLDLKNNKMSRNIKLNLDQNKEKENDIFITGFRMKTSDDFNGQINNLKGPYKVKQFQNNKKNNNYTLTLKQFLPPVKGRKLMSTYNSIDNTNKTNKEDNNSFNFFTNTVTKSIKRKNRFLTIDEKKVNEIMKYNKNIKNNINFVKNQFEYKYDTFEALYKYLNWKYGTADVNKYFIDIDTYKKNPEDIIDRKKSFYDKLDDMVDFLIKKRKMKDMENIKKQYGININKKKDNIDYNTINVDESEKLFLKGKKIKNKLKEVYERRKLEKGTRVKIKNILNRSKDRISIINKNFNTFRLKELKELRLNEKIK